VNGLSTQQVFPEEDPEQLITLAAPARPSDLDSVVRALRSDLVVLVPDLDLTRADLLLEALTARLGLLERLKLQAAFADFHRHRRRVGKYLMSVNERGPNHVIPPHSEGDSFIQIQLAAFYCLQNDTDGGATILLHQNDASPVWPSLREKLTKIAGTARPLTPAEWTRIKTLYRLKSADKVSAADRIVKLREGEIPGLLLADVLVAPVRSHSELLGKAVYTYWDSIASMDHASWTSFAGLLRTLGVEGTDNAAFRRIWSSDLDHNSLFQCRLTRKLAPGELILFNNMSWAHSTTSWSPTSGSRNVAAAFA